LARSYRIEDVGKIAFHGDTEAIVDVEASSAKATEAHLLEIGAVVTGTGGEIKSTFSALVRPPVEAFFKSGTNIEELRSRGLLRHIGALAPDELGLLQQHLIAGAEANLNIHNIPLEQLYPSHTDIDMPGAARPLHEVRSEFIDWLHSNQVGSLAAYNKKYDETVLSRHGMDLPFNNDIMHEASKALNLRPGEMGAEHVARVTGVLGLHEQEAHRGLEDAILEARIRGAINDPATREASIARLFAGRGETAVKNTVTRSFSEELNTSVSNAYKKLSSMTLADVGHWTARNPVLTGAAALGSLFIIGSLAKPLSLIPSRDDNFNTITGLNENGSAADIRHKMTDFGSGFDPLKALFNGMKTLEEITAMSGFREALERGTVVKELGTGAFGKAELLETTLSGRPFQYVRKTVTKPDSVLHLKALQNEAFILGKMHEGPLTPSPYLHTGTALYMEKMPGMTLRDLGRAAGEPRAYLGAEQGQQLFEEVERLAKAGYVNSDIHASNLLYDPELERLSWIDFGLVQQVGKDNPVDIAFERITSQLTAEAREKIKFSHPERILSNIAGNTIKGLPPPTSFITKAGTPTKDFGSPWKGLKPTHFDHSARDSKKLAMAAMQRTANEMSGVLGLLGGKGHTRYTNRGR
jgi:DNA polymerase III epsilon subunit-like protein/tRNA A-37 threonylcarbamoyl transferase component Bud32